MTLEQENAAIERQKQFVVTMLKRSVQEFNAWREQDGEEYLNLALT